ncbi:ABC transporter substrate-binding protein [Streptosporangium lutulentum]|uniref:NitT/TauT family transport system substrate-binding protein n=1 Tax=Streptosporangium lutulentum TaxID=1461250 RepID=A0ABT9QCV0_9ACTN|nr:ABC transporter substrate-binding protein [Streptosporangium lutulentum]MDP9844592.1 NitT/TauT family transport system substrate-binding protein [Streptosporangium lutulentum]
MRRFTRSVAVAIAAGLLAAVTGCGNSGNSGNSPEADSSATKALEKVTYLTSFGNFGRDAYAWVAKEKGFFAEAGFEVDIKPGGGTGDNLSKIEAGAAMFTPLDLTGLLLARGNGGAKDITVVAGIQQNTMAAIISLEGNQIATPKDLEGKTLADSPSSVVRNLFPTYAKLAGVDASKVKWVNGQPANLIGLLAGGTVAGIGQFVVGKPTVESVAKDKKAVVLPYSDVMDDLYGNVLVTSAKIAKENPDTVKRFTAALIKGLVYSVDNPKEAGELLQKNVPAAAAAPAAAECELMAAFVRPDGSSAPVGSIDTERVARSIETLQGAGAIPAGLTPDQLIDSSLTPAS